MKQESAGSTQAFLSALLDDDPHRLYDFAPCGFLSMTPDGTILKCNATFLDMTGTRLDQLVGRARFSELLTRGGQIYYETHYSPLLRMHGHADEIALELKRTDLPPLPVLVNAVLERDDEGNPTVVRAAVFDATQRRQYERELLDQSQRLAASEAHARSLAQTLQQTLIPPLAPKVPGLDVGACYRPAGDGTEVGGDFYDIFQTGDESWAVVLGDVCGKGVEAAVLTALSRYTLRAAAMQNPSPARALAVLNEVLYKHESERFATAVYLDLRQSEQSWITTCAHGGHPLLLHRAADGRVTPLGRPGDVLGLFPDVTVFDHVSRLEPGDAILAYTDGVPEARSPDGLYGEARITALLSRPLTSAQERVDEILADVLSYQSARNSDDIACVLVHRPRSG